MSATITVQFIERVRVYPLSDDMASIECVMGTGGDNGFGGSVGIVLRNPTEARLLLEAAAEALRLLGDGTTPTLAAVKTEDPK